MKILFSCITFLIFFNSIRAEANEDQLRIVVASQQAEISGLKKDISELRALISKSIRDNGNSAIWIGDNSGLVGPQGGQGPRGFADMKVIDMDSDTTGENLPAFHLSIKMRKACLDHGYNYGFAGGEMSTKGDSQRNLRVVCVN